MQYVESSLDSTSFMARLDSAGVYALLRAAIIKLASLCRAYVTSTRLDSTLLASTDAQGHYSGRAEIRPRQSNNS
jgi:hypothetical protein